MGGRSEVVGSPAVELLKHMEMQLEKEESEAEKEQFKIWIEHLSKIYTQQSMGGKDARFTQGKKEFEKAIMPNMNKPKQKELKWDFEGEG